MPLSGSLVIAQPNQKTEGLGIQAQIRSHLTSGCFKKSSMSWAILIMYWDDQLVVLCAKAGKLFMQTVQ